MFRFTGTGDVKFENIQFDLIKEYIEVSKSRSVRFDIFLR
jgi:hypothetical protein